MQLQELSSTIVPDILRYYVDRDFSFPKHLLARETEKLSYLEDVFHRSTQNFISSENPRKLDLSKVSPNLAYITWLTIPTFAKMALTPKNTEKTDPNANQTIKTIFKQIFHVNLICQDPTYYITHPKIPAETKLFDLTIRNFVAGFLEVTGVLLFPLAALVIASVAIPIFILFRIITLMCSCKNEPIIKPEYIPTIILGGIFGSAYCLVLGIDNIVNGILKMVPIAGPSASKLYAMSKVITIDVAKFALKQAKVEIK